MATSITSTPLGAPPRNSGGGSKQGAPPTTEIGAISSLGLSSWTQFAFDELEMVPELQFPQSVRTYANMRNDSQLDGLYAGCTWPILRYKFMIDPNGCDPARVKKLAADLNLPIKGDDPTAPKPRARQRFVFKHHAQDALKSLIFGFYPFEIVGFYNGENQGGDGLWHLKKLAPRPPVTVQEILLDENGDMLAVLQNVSRPGTNGAMTAPEIPVDKLVMYSWDKDGAAWQGRSMFRSVFRNWLIKDRLLRVDALKHERNGMGVPVAFGSPGMTDQELMALQRLAASYKAGESASAAFPNKADMKLLGVQGTLPDTIASINYHDEQMARRFLMMFLQLGSTLHGSRSLGKDFVDYFQLAQDFVGSWMLDIFNEHMVEEWWNWNYGETEEYCPFITYERDDDPRLAAADLALMIQNNVIQVDDEVEQAVREAMDLPAFDPNAKRSYMEGNSPEDQMKLMQQKTSPPGDQPGQPSTQPGRSDPETPPEDQSTHPDNVKARRDHRHPATASPPRAGSSGASGLQEWEAMSDAI